MNLANALMVNKSRVSGNNLCPVEKFRNAPTGQKKKISKKFSFEILLRGMSKDLIFAMFIGIFIFLIILGLIFLGEDKQKPSFSGMEGGISVRKPAVAGAFYPASNDILKQKVNQFLEQTEIPEISGYIKAAIIPHAGYDYSGWVAAYVYQAIKQLESPTIILIGPSHQYYLQGIAIDGNDEWETPLGRVAIDKELRDRLIKENSLFKINSAAHEKEHCLEVQLPFLQTIFSDFKILPILVNDLSENDSESIGQTLAEQIDENIIIIASSDMSHYPAYEQANYADGKVIKAILTGKIEQLNQTISDLEKENIEQADTFLCGQQAVGIVMRVAQKIEANNIQLLKYANSGDVEIGDKSQVVGYSSIVFASQRKGSELNKQEQQELLRIAQESVENYVSTSTMPNFESSSFFLNKKQGAFVTLRKNGQLRGCIGRFEPDIPLYQVVSQMAIAAATEDVRFQPVTSNELDELDYEISVLSPLKKIDNWNEIEIGKHGVEIKQGLRHGVFLPQVATENNWNLEQFLSNLCVQKVGLAPDCYQQEDIEIYTFNAQVFGE